MTKIPARTVPRRTRKVWSYGPLSTEDRKEMTANEGHHALRDTIDGPLEANETKAYETSAVFTPTAASAVLGVS